MNNDYNNDYKWLQNYKLAKAYYIHHGNLLIPATFKTINGYEPDDSENAVHLGTWIQNQRQNYDNLSDERKKLLTKIDFTTKPNDYLWNQKYQLAKIYYIHHENLKIPYNFKTINGYEPDDSEDAVNLSTWIQTQRQNYDNLSDERKQLLAEIKFIVKAKTKPKIRRTWQQNYQLAKIYYLHHGNLLIPSQFKTTNGYEPDDSEDAVNLGTWIQIQRKNYNNLNEEQKQLLSEINFVLNVKEYTWNQFYELAKAYYTHYGDLFINYHFITSNGYEYDNKGLKLGIWIHNLRSRYEELSNERKQQLSEINFIVNPNDYRWHLFYKLAKIYYSHYSNLLIPYNFKTSNGYEPDNSENGLDLGQWIHIQRKYYDTLSDKRKQLLEEIKFIINVKEYKWNQFYELAKAYYNHYGNLEIPRDFETTDRYKLGQWIQGQKNTTDENSKKGQLLSQIGIIWRTKRKTRKKTKSIINTNN